MHYYYLYIKEAVSFSNSLLFQAEDDGSSANVVEPDHTHLMELAEAPSGMRDSDLRSMKDQLLIETSELLGVSGPLSLSLFDPPLPPLCV